MIQFLVGFIIIFIYPFLNRVTSQILIALSILIAVIPIFFIDTESWGSYLLIWIVIFSIGILFRYYVQKAKNNTELNDIADKYNSNKD